MLPVMCDLYEANAYRVPGFSGFFKHRPSHAVEEMLAISLVLIMVFIPGLD